jgi:ribosomal protein S27AE
MLYYAWRPYDDRAIRVVENTSVASWSAKWIGGKQITRCLADYDGYKPHSRDDRALLSDLWPLLDEAHIVIAHNGERFDKKKINYRFMVHQMGVPSPYSVVDTLREVKGVASFDSHRLNELTRQLGIGQKIRTGGADLWFDCLEGKASAWRKMKQYNARDVAPLLEDFYFELLPWMKRHPNHGAYTGISSCPKCGSTRLMPHATAVATTRRYQQFVCGECGNWARSSEKMGGRTAVVNAR